MGGVSAWLEGRFWRQLLGELREQFWIALVCVMLSFICAGRLRVVTELVFEQFLYGTTLYQALGQYRVVHSVWMVLPVLILSTTLNLLAYTVVTVNAARPDYERAASPGEAFKELLPYTADLMGCAALIALGCASLYWGLSLIFALEVYLLFGVVAVLSMFALLWVCSHVMLVPTVMVMESLTWREAISRSSALMARQRVGIMLALSLSCGPVLGLIFLMMIGLVLFELEGLIVVLEWAFGFVILYIPAVLSGLVYERCLERSDAYADAELFD